MSEYHWTKILHFRDFEIYLCMCACIMLLDDTLLGLDLSFYQVGSGLAPSTLPCRENICCYFHGAEDSPEANTNVTFKGILSDLIMVLAFLVP